MKIELQQSAAPLSATATATPGPGPRPRLRARFARRPLAFDAGLWRAAAGGLWAASCAGAGVSALGVPTGFGAGADVSTAIALNAAALALAGLLLAWLFRFARRPLPPLTISAAAYSLALLTCCLRFGDIDWPFALLLSAVYLAAGAAAVPALAADPSQPGAYAYRTFTYGSGTDRQRAAFAGQAELKSATVDASAYIEDWPWLRELFWGFDQRALPLNGRVWMPEGDGPFPVVLMVHGNHLMEDFSDEGYAYLGELLASRGFAAISVDENFLNYSVWSGIPKQDMKVRAWLLLRHIGQLQRFAADPSTPFYDRLDFGDIALLGHSRGGQAAAMAADRGQWFAADDSLPAADSYDVRAVVALAPTDTTVDGGQARLHDISYLTLQGASDADISTFDGERQYDRTSFAAGSAAFKASLYIGGANHGQFNTTWGARDNSMPAGLFLSRPELSGGDQRQIAKAYVAAFLEDALHGDRSYEPLLRDYRAGAAFLPQTAYYGQYEDGSFAAAVRFDDPEADRSRPSPGVAADAAGMTQWGIREALDRNERGKGDYGVRLQWPADGGSYTLRADSLFPEGTDLMFALADLSWSLPSHGSSLRPTIEVADAGGHAASLPLDDVMPVLVPARTAFLWLNGLAPSMDDGKYVRETQPAFQTYDVPLSLFAQANPELDTGRLVRVTFAFAGGPGAAMLDDIGFGDGTGAPREE